MQDRVVNLDRAFASFSEHWSPRLAGEFNGMVVKLVKLQGEFVWHRHEDADEMFLVTRGALRIGFRDREVTVHPGEFYIIPRGVEHITAAGEETHALILEPAGTLNTGNVENERSVHSEGVIAQLE